MFDCVFKLIAASRDFACDSTGLLCWICIYWTRFTIGPGLNKGNKASQGLGLGLGPLRWAHGGPEPTAAPDV